MSFENNPEILAEIEPYTAAMDTRLQHVRAQLGNKITQSDWIEKAPLIEAINRIKKQKNAVILAHNYMTPDIYHGVADIVGDSLQLAIAASKTNADIIVQGGVKFMAETSKLLCPNKKVLIPDLRAGCSLAASITPEDVRALRVQYPNLPVVAYVNTTADVKAEVDICCTSANAVKIVESLGVPEVICLPDQYLAHYVQTQTSVRVIPYAGACEVHERFTGDELRIVRQATPNVKIIAHPECPPDVIAEADYTGSTKGMIDWVLKHQPEKVVLVTECSMADNISAQAPNVEFVRPCNLCPHMKRISLENILEALIFERHEITIPHSIIERAVAPIHRMIAVN